MSTPPKNAQTLNDTDVLIGAAAIAEFIFGDPTMRRQIYYRAERGELPHFYWGNCLCSTRTAILRMVAKLMQDKTDQRGDR